MTHDRLPLVVFPRQPGADAGDQAAALRATAERYLARLGAIVFRGFELRTQARFRRFVAGFGVSLAHAASELEPRAELAQPVELGHVRAASGGWPLSVWQCAPRGEAGFTLLADGRDVFRALPKSLRARFVDRGLMQVQRVELTSGVERSTLEAAWRAGGASVEWLEANVALVRRRVPAVIAHPETHELVWLCGSLADADGRAPARGDQRLVHADGSEIEPSMLEAIEAAFDESRTVLEWEAGDVLLLDNLIMSHVHVAPEGRTFAPLVLHGEPTFSPSADDVRWVETPRPGPRRPEPSESPRALAQPCRSWA